jgi:hypothetical protein
VIIYMIAYGKQLFDCLRMPSLATRRKIPNAIIQHMLWMRSKPLPKLWYISKLTNDGCQRHGGSPRFSTMHKSLLVE